MLVVRGFRAGEVSGKETVVTPAPDAWSRFWLAMDADDVWRWLPDYTDNDVLDGTQTDRPCSPSGRSKKTGASAPCRTPNSLAV